MIHVLGLAAALAALWLLLSGHFGLLLLSLGAVSIALVTWLANRMDIVDHEGQPLHLSLDAPRYWLWLGGQIVASAWDVSRRIWLPGPPIAPVLRSTPADQLSRLGQVIYANSITLTPGTLTVDVHADRIDVHTLDATMLEELEGGRMLDRVRGLDTR